MSVGIGTVVISSISLTVRPTQLDVLHNTFLWPVVYFPMCSVETSSYLALAYCLAYIYMPFYLFLVAKTLLVFGNTKIKYKL